MSKDFLLTQYLLTNIANTKYLTEDCNVIGPKYAV